HPDLHSFPTRRSSDLNLTRGVEFVKQTYETPIAICSANFRRAAQIITDGVPHPNSPTLGQIFARWRNRRLAKCVERFADRKFRRSEEHTSELQSRFDL